MGTIASLPVARISLSKEKESPLFVTTFFFEISISVTLLPKKELIQSSLYSFFDLTNTCSLESLQEMYSGSTHGE